VIYGNKETSVLISMDPIELQRELRRVGFFSRVYQLELEGEAHRVLPRDIQVDPVTDRPLHIDFMRFSKDTRVVIEVAVDFKNEDDCPGIKQGGVLNVVRYAIELKCSPENVPENIPVDLSGLVVGDSIHISSVQLPEDVELTITDRDFTIATIAAPTVVVEETVEEEEVTEEGEADAAEKSSEESSEEAEKKED
jgi:large subunit ribosomal protein L25